MNRQQEQTRAWGEFCTAIYELAVARLRASRSNGAETRREAEWAESEAFFKATALAAPHTDTLLAVRDLRDTMARLAADIERDLVRCRRIRNDDVE